MDKHTNIGMTATLAREFKKMCEEHGLSMPSDLTELFEAEAKECDHHHETGQCTFYAKEDLEMGDSFTTFACDITKCPLMELADAVVEDMTADDAQAHVISLFKGEDYLGPCMHCGGDVNQRNLGHVDDHMQVCRPCMKTRGL